MAQYTYLELAGEIPFPDEAEFEGYTGDISGQASIKLIPGKTLGIAVGYKLDGFSRNNEGINIAVDELRVHSPYVGLSFNMLGKAKFMVEPQLNVGYAFVRHFSENFPELAESNDTEGINVFPTLNVGFQIPGRIRVFAKVSQNYLYKQNGDGELEQDPNIQFTNLGAGFSLSIF